MSDAWATAVAAVGASAVGAVAGLVGAYLGLRQADKNSRREDERRRTERRIEYLEAKRERLAKEFDEAYELLAEGNIEASTDTKLSAKLFLLFRGRISQAFNEASAAALKNAAANPGQTYNDALRDEMGNVYAVMQMELRDIDEEIDGLTSTKHVTSPTNPTTV